MTEKCLWCAIKKSNLHEIEVYFKGKNSIAKVCSMKCEQDLRDILQYTEDHKRHYILGFTFSYVIGLIITFLRIKVDYGALGIFIIAAGSGLTLIKYPFVTPQTVSLLGAKKAIASGRIIGALNIIIGVAFWWFLAVYLS